jgi:hypothetical protein
MKDPDLGAWCVDVVEDGGDVTGSGRASCEAAGFASYPIVAHWQQEMEARGGRSGWIAKRSRSSPLPEEVEPC